MTDRNERDADLIERVEQTVGMGHAAWDTIDPLEIAAAFREALAAPAASVDVERLRVLLDRIKAAAKNIDHSPAPLHEGKAIIIGAASMALEMIDSAGGAKCTGADCKPRDGGTLCQSCGGDITPQPAKDDGAVADALMVVDDAMVRRAMNEKVAAEIRGEGPNEAMESALTAALATQQAEGVDRG